jgi:hypothetical protein
MKIIKNEEMFKAPVLNASYYTYLPALSKRNYKHRQALDVPNFFSALELKASNALPAQRRRHEKLSMLSSFHCVSV